LKRKVKPGDKVRFLNTVGGGKIVKVLNEFMVSVAIDDGFEIPTLLMNWLPLNLPVHQAIYSLIKMSVAAKYQ